MAEAFSTGRRPARGGSSTPGQGNNISLSALRARSKPTDSGGEIMEKKVLNAMKKAGKPVRPSDVAKMIGEDSKYVLYFYLHIIRLLRTLLLTNLFSHPFGIL